MGTIIVATDGSDAAAKAAASGFELAGQTGDVVTIVVVREPIPASLGLPFAYYSQEFLDEYQARAEKILDAAEDQARSAGLNPEGIVVTGEATREICKLAQERDARMIVIGAHGWGAIRSFVLGSTATGVLHHAPCPVLCGPPGSRTPADFTSDH